MVEATLFALLGIFYWAYRRSKNKTEKRWSELASGIQHLYSELKSRDARWSETKSQVESLSREVEKLHTQLAALAEHPPVQAPAASRVHEAPPPLPARTSVEAEPVLAKKAEPPAPAPAGAAVEHEVPAPPPPAPVAIPPAAAVPPLSSESAARLTQDVRPPEAPPAKPQPLPAPAQAHGIPKVPPAVAKEPAAPKVTPTPVLAGEVPKPAYAPVHPIPTVAGSAHPQAQLPPPRFAVQPPPGPPMSERLKHLLNLEELLGTNYLIKIGVVILVIGVAGFIFSNLDKIPLWLRVFTSFAMGLGMLVSGVRFEAGKYRLLARAGMGGGWAVIFITTWALHHAGKPPLLSSEPVDFVLLMMVATAMVAHTLRYDSQLITGFAFLLPSLTVTVTLGFAGGMSDAVRMPALVGNAMLALGLVVLVLRRQWFEVEVFGVVVTYLNHFFWIRPIIEHGTRAERAASLYGSAALLVAYWAIFRASYIIRKVSDRHQEAVSSVAALLNTIMLLVLLKYQAAHPELAFWFLLLFGAVEVDAGQLPITRRRRAAFVILTTLGATFLVAALPLRFAGATLPVMLLAESEAFFLAGVFTREIVFRRLGMLAGLLVAFKLEWLALGQINTSGFNGLLGADFLKAAVVYGLATLVFYGNSHGVARRWPDLIQTKFEDWSLRGYSYIAASVAFVGIWLVFPTLWLTVAWSVFALVLAILGARLKIRQPSKQVPFFTLAAALGALMQNLSTVATFHHLSLRLVTVSLAVAMFYLISRWGRRAEIANAKLMGEIHTWAATALAGVLVWYECPEMWRAVAWSVMALVLALAGRWLKLREFSDQAHFLAGAGFIAAFDLNLLTLEPHHYAELPLETVLLTAVLLYACSRHIRLTRFPGETLLSAGHTWTATLLMASLAWYELRAEYAAPAWMALALIVAVAGRTFKLKRYSFQAYTLALVASVAAVAINLIDTSPHTHDLRRLITVSIVVALLYVCSRWAGLVEVEGARDIGALHTWLGTGILAALAWYETPSDYSAPIWCGMALALVVLGNTLKRRSLEAQGHCLAMAGIASALAVNLHQATLSQFDERLLLTVGICAAFLYLCSLWNGALEAAKPPRIPEVYTWAASTLVFLLAWYVLQPITVAVAWALFGMVLFELGMGRRSYSLRLQSYLVLAGSFARIFYVNINAAGNGETLSPRVWTMLFLAAAYFYLYGRLVTSGDDLLKRDRKLEAPHVYCYLGGITIAALLRMELDPNWVIAAWAGMVVLLLVLAWRLRQAIFLEQGLILSLAVLFRTCLFNFYQSPGMRLTSEHSRLLYVGVTVALLFLAVPLSLRLRPGAAANIPIGDGRIARLLATLSRYPDQVVFFTAFGLLTTLLYLEVSTTVTLVWGTEAFVIFLFALWAGVRSFRLAAIALLLVCVGRICLVDWWRFEGNSRWLTGIGLGAALITVGYLSIRYLEAIRKYL